MSLQNLSAARSPTSASRCRCRRSATCSPASSIFGVILVTAIPFGIYDLVEAMDNVESAAAAGDSFPTTRVLTADGVVSLIGCLMGNPVHQCGLHRPSGLEGDGRAHRLFGRHRHHGDRAGLVRHDLADDGADPGGRDPADPALHRHADRLAGLPGDAAPACAGHRAGADAELAAWAKNQIDGALGAAGTTASAVGLDKLGDQGVLYHGLSVLGGGATLGGLMLAAIAVFIIEREFFKAAGFAVAGAVLTFFGLMHGEASASASHRCWRSPISASVDYCSVARGFPRCR